MFPPPPPPSVQVKEPLEWLYQDSDPTKSPHAGNISNHTSPALPYRQNRYRAEPLLQQARGASAVTAPPARNCHNGCGQDTPHTPLPSRAGDSLPPPRGLTWSGGHPKYSSTRLRRSSTSAMAVARAAGTRRPSDRRLASAALLPRREQPVPSLLLPQEPPAGAGEPADRLLSPACRTSRTPALGRGRRAQTPLRSPARPPGLAAPIRKRGGGRREITPIGSRRSLALSQ